MVPSGGGGGQGAAPFPDMKSIPAEAVQKRWYNWPLKKWEKGTITVKPAPPPLPPPNVRPFHRTRRHSGAELATGIGFGTDFKSHSFLLTLRFLPFGKGACPTDGIPKEGWARQFRPFLGVLERGRTFRDRGCAAVTQGEEARAMIQQHDKQF